MLRLLFAVLVVSVAGCGPREYHCGTELVYDPSVGYCVCPPGTALAPDMIHCLSTVDGCAPTVETCNGIDDDCDGSIDGAAASATCALTMRATGVACTAGECVITTCTSGFDDCDDEHANGCEAALDTLANCGTCGNTCGWDCEAGACDDAVAIAGGSGMHNCVLLESGHVACWGANDVGQLGIGVSGAGTERTAPVRVVGASGSGLLGSIVDVAVGQAHSCAADTGGGVWCWGANAFGQLGDRSMTPRSLPVRVSDVSGASQVSAGYEHSCAIVTGGRVACWGANDRAQLGQGNRFVISGGIEVVGIDGAVEIGGTGRTTCVRLFDGTVRCWGSDLHGALGFDSGDSMDRPVAPIGIDGAVSLAVGREHGCVVRGDSTTWCWGSNYSLELGSAYPVGASPLPFQVTVPIVPLHAFVGGRAFFVDVTGALASADAVFPGPPVVDLGAFGGPAYSFCVCDGSGAIACHDGARFVVVPPP